MARPTGTVLGQKAYAEGVSAPMLDPTFGGQHGMTPEYGQYISSANYVRRNIVARVIEFPRGFSVFPEARLLQATLKALIELHPIRIEGLQQGVTWSFSETAFGGAGEMQEDPTNAERARSNPSFSYVDRYGRPIQRFYNFWGRNLIMDPESKYPLVVTRGDASVRDLLPDFTSATVLFFEPDPTFTSIDKAWLCANMMPKTDGAVDGSRDLTTAGQTSEFSIDFTALTQSGLGVTQFAQKVLDGMNRSGANPNMRKAFMQDLHADVRAVTETGFAERLAQASRDVVSL